MRSFLKYLSTRRKYWSPLRKLLELKIPESIIGVLQGMFSNAAGCVTQRGRFCGSLGSLPKYLSAVIGGVPPTATLVGTYVFRIFVPNEPGLFEIGRAH